MSVTPEFGWPLIEPTDFVTNLPADFEAFADAVDADVDAIKTTADAAQPNVITTEGDLVIGDASGDPVRLPIGAIGEVLLSDGDTAYWDTIAGGGKNWTLLNSGNTSVGAGSSFTVSGISGVDNLLILVDQVRATASARIALRFNNDSANHTYFGMYIRMFNTYDATGSGGAETTNGDRIPLGLASGSSNSVINGGLIMSGANSTGVKAFNSSGGGSSNANSGHALESYVGFYGGTSTISDITIITNSGNFAAGNLRIYGSA